MYFICLFSVWLLCLPGIRFCIIDSGSHCNQCVYVSVRTRLQSSVGVIGLRVCFCGRVRLTASRGVYVVHCTWYIVRGTLYDVQCTSYNVRGTLYVVQCTWYNVRGTLYVVHCTWYTVRGTLYVVHCTWYTVRGTLYVVHCTTYTVRRTLYVVHCTWYTVRRTLYVVHCTWYTVRGTLYVVHCTWYTVRGTLYHVHCTSYTVRVLVHADFIYIYVGDIWCIRVVKYGLALNIACINRCIYVSEWWFNGWLVMSEWR